MHAGRAIIGAESLSLPEPAELRGVPQMDLVMAGQAGRGLSEPGGGPFRQGSKDPPAHWLVLQLQIESEPARERDKIKSLIMIKWLKKSPSQPEAPSRSGWLRLRANRRWSLWLRAPSPLLPLLPHQTSPHAPPPRPEVPQPELWSGAKPPSVPGVAAGGGGPPGLWTQKLHRPGLKPRLCQLPAA